VLKCAQCVWSSFHSNNIQQPSAPIVQAATVVAARNAKARLRLWGNNSAGPHALARDPWPFVRLPSVRPVTKSENLGDFEVLGGFGRFWALLGCRSCCTWQFLWSDILIESYAFLDVIWMKCCLCFKGSFWSPVFEVAFPCARGTSNISDPHMLK